MSDRPELEPIRAELFSIERLEQQAASLAAAQGVTTTPRKGRRLSRRLEDNERVLVESYRALAQAVHEDRTITPAAEWLIDSFHIVEEQVREIRDDLPPGFYRELPKLAAGPLAGYPRVFGVAWDFVAHTDSRLDLEALRRYVDAYQRVQPLTIGELWAVAITLRLVLVENLRRLADQLVRRRTAHQEADELADSLLGLGGRPGEPVSMNARRLGRAPLATSFAVQLVQRLREQDPAVTPALQWLEQRLAAQGTTPDEIVLAEHQRQAAMNVSVRNVITSMRLLSTVDWAGFFESVSLVDAVLRDGTGFAAMDFTTRDRYRHAIEELSRGSGLTELEIARRAVLHTTRARDATGGSGSVREDPGHYLISKGRMAFERELGFHVTARHRLLRAYVRHAAAAYLGSAAILSLLVLAMPLVLEWKAGAELAGLLGLGALALISASDLALTLINRLVTELLGPRMLPKLELREGVPENLRTLVAIPTLLTSPADIDEQIERLEVHYLANSEGDLRFALLSDWMDAPAESLPEDDDLLAAAIAGIAALNERHGSAPDGGERFFLYHRRRVFNPGELKWMGWERKRGKLHELNRLLQGATDTTVVPIAGRPLRVPDGVRYVVTLDADTRLPRDAVRRLVGTMAHPLNRARVDRRLGRVVEGYGVLQPRVTPTLPAGDEGSLFQRVFSGPSGIDPYAFAVSDVYQDLFHEGSYVGKGIYDVAAFEAALAERVPDNTLLSHDLFEGLFARAGLATDIELFEQFPARYEVAAARQHRWVRGDWQLLPWIFGRAIPLIGRWKMIDNLRRSLSAPTALATLIASWTLPFASPVAWTGFVVATIALPALLPFVTGLLPRRRGISKRSHLRAVGTDLSLALAHLGLSVTLLAHQAWLMTDAIVRTLVRRFLTRRRLLEWVTAEQARSGLDPDLPAVYRRMGGAVALAVAAGTLVALRRPEAWPVAAPFVLLWALSPLVVRWISLPPKVTGPEPLSPSDARLLRSTARRTWRFFETFVGPEDHALPPDNFQEEPKPVVAHRTSPTNLGLYLLATVTARDFGWLGTTDAVERLEATFETMAKLERFRGHFYNWYGTRDLRPLDPRYVSAVDSGNLAGHLLAFAQACREMADRPLLGPSTLAGVEDALLLVREAARAVGDDRRTQLVSRRHLDQALEALAAALEPTPAPPAAWVGRLADLEARARTVADVAWALADERGGSDDAELLAWVEAARSCIASHARDLELLSPWADISGPDADVPTLAEIPDRARTAVEQLRARGASPALIGRVERSATAAAALLGRCTDLAQQAARLFDQMDFGLLFDPIRKLFAIGYRIADGSLDSSYYDLLASEARLTSFVAIAKGDVPAAHWLHLGRPLTPVDRGAALVSWSGSMFEYLMPALVMRSPVGSLLHQTNRLVVRRQMSYGAERGVPWGVSESAYNVRDVELTYQYSNFGVPGLGLKRGLSEDVVVAPYATALAAMIDPTAAAANFRRLAAAGARGAYGYYEALDFTRTRVPKGESVALVKAYMAHHQGMSLVAIGNVLEAGAMRARFHAEPIVRATELLLQERTPRGVAVARPRAEEVQAAATVRALVPPAVRRFTSVHDRIPRTHLLSNGRYAVMLTSAGSGYSRCGDLAITRWREDVTRDCWGTYVFLRDTESGKVWSAGYQPRGVEPDGYEVNFGEDRAEIHRRDGAVATTLEVVVSPEDNAEIRRVSLMNLGLRTRGIELTSYAEIVLAPPAADAAHPAFSNLFVQTEWVPEVGALLATRRLRAHGERAVWAAHVVAIEGHPVGGVQYETDRARFLGRGRSIRTPMSVVDGRPLSNTVGPVLDPIVSLRRRLRLEPGTGARVAFATLVADSRAAALQLADKYRDPATFERVVTLAWTQAQVQLHHLRIEPDEAHLFQDLASWILHSGRTLRPSADLLKRNTRGPSALWAHGISGDIPIVLVRIDDYEDRDLVRQLLRAHEYWRLRQLSVDLVILNERPASYAQDLQGSLEALVRAGQASARHEGHDPHGSVFILRTDLISADDRDLFQSAARVVLLSRRGSLAEQVARLQPGDAAAPEARRAPAEEGAAVAPPHPEREFFNGLGGFAADGREYVTVLGEGQSTPAPWINVVANPTFGFHVSESGSGYTWSVNSRENKLTPWSNDAVSDPSGEMLYVRDEDSGAVWGPTALPIREDAWPYVARHGQGYSRFEHTAHGIGLELLQFVPLADPIKVSRLTLENLSGRSRRLSVTAYVEWALGVSRSASAPFIVTEIDPATGGMLARNPWNEEFGSRVAFADLGGRQTTWTADRTEFLGRNGAPDDPASLQPGAVLSGSVGAGLDPCAALQAPFELRAGGRIEIVFLLGQAATREQASELILRYRSIDVDAALRAVTDHWDEVLGGIQVRTPERSMDLMLNRWLLYQTLACRVWARAGFYQASGAYGFRDQLQDVMALTVAQPDLAREHLLRAAARQFVEGDVQHWWHPPSGRGVRTRISDDRLWLPYAVAHFLEVTGDAGVLDAIVPFLDGPPLGPEESEAYFAPTVSEQRATVFEHCARALDLSLAVGSHGLPLIGGGDWNDGMNRVGREGQGESVWLGWFLHATLREWADLARARGDHARAAAWHDHVGALEAALEAGGWDGDWYRRAYFDDGTPLGSISNDECRIDSIAQSWGVLSGAAEPARAARAMAAVEEYLVRRGDGLILLLTPPFDRTPLDPGYIKGYLPGIRENGGQYTHAAIWTLLAFAALGDGDRAGELFTLLNPINHASTRAGVYRYKVEPYVAAADVYAEPPHVGRGGWTWYTGAAGWMYRAGIEWILGVRLRGTRLHIDPCIPRAWDGFQVSLRHRSARYEIAVENPHGVTRGIAHVELDGAALAPGKAEIPLADDGATHQVRIVLG